MEHLDLRTDDNASCIEAATRIIFAGGIIAFPTDTVYGLGCDPQQSLALERMYELKGRDRSKPFILLFASVEELLEYIKPDHILARETAEHFLPGGLTLIVPKPSFVPDVLTAGKQSIGLRVPDHAFCRRLLERTGPLASTSANYSGAPAYQGEQSRDFPPVDLFLDDGPVGGGRASSVLDLTSMPPRILRNGAIDDALLTEWLKGQ